MTSRPAAQLLPPRRSPDAPYRLAVVCLGNICRSPMGEVVLTHKIERAGLADEVEVVSAGTGDWHIGNPMDRRAAAALTARGYDASLHRAQQFDSGWLDELDLVLAMDRGNYADIAAFMSLDGADDGPDGSRLQMFRSFDPRAHDADRDVPDPYYGGDDGFDHVLAMVERTATAIVAALAAEVLGG